MALTRLVERLGRAQSFAPIRSLFGSHSAFRTSKRLEQEHETKSVTGSVHFTQNESRRRMSVCMYVADSAWVCVCALIVAERLEASGREAVKCLV